jgi:protein DGCR14
MSSQTTAKTDNRQASASADSTTTTVTKIGSDAASTAVARTGTGRPVYKSNIPAPAPQTILEEDEYIEALSKIIERDFFPDLARLKRQHAYLDAVEQNDSERIRTAARELAGNDTPLAKRRLKTPGKASRKSRNYYCIEAKQWSFALGYPAMLLKIFYEYQPVRLDLTV